MSTSRPALITPTRVQSASTSLSRWLDSTTVVPSAAKCRSSARISPMPRGSRPLVGSSRSNSSGLRRSAAAMPRRWRIPSEYARTGRPSIPPRPTRTSASSTRSARSRRPLLPAASSSRRFARPDRCGHAAGPSTSAPTRGSTCAASRGIGLPSSATRPAVGCTSPSSIRTSVVLPDPFGPSSPNRAPVGTVSDTPSTATTCRKRLVRPSVSIDGHCGAAVRAARRSPGPAPSGRRRRAAASPTGRGCARPPTAGGWRRARRAPSAPGRQPRPRRRPSRRRARRCRGWWARARTRPAPCRTRRRRAAACPAARPGPCRRGAQAAGARSAP